MEEQNYKDERAEGTLFFVGGAYGSSATFYGLRKTSSCPT
jgi:hypothetical protein